MIYLQLIFCTVLLIKKGISRKLSYLEFFFKNINLFNFILFKFNEDINPFYSNSFKKYLKRNEKKLKKINLKDKKIKEEKILVEGFINQPAYTVSNGIISYYLSKICNVKSTAIIRKGDLKSRFIFRSFGIKNFIYFKNKNIFENIIYLIKAIKFLKNQKNIDSIIKQKYKNIHVGLTAYDSYIRFIGDPTLDKINSEFIIFLSDALYSSDFFEKIFKRHKFTSLVQSEASFIPLSCLFQMALKNKLKVFSRFGKERFTIRKYDNIEQCFSFRGRISQKLFNLVEKKFKNKSLKIANQIQKQKLKLGSFGMDITMYKVKKSRSGKKEIEIIGSKKQNNNKKILVDKNYIKKLFNWNNKKIVVFFLSYLIDANFPYGNRINSKDNYQWTKFILDKIKNINNVNWIIKDHPITKMYGQVPKKNFDKRINFLTNKFNHIKKWPKEFSNMSLLKITDVAITSLGSAGIEYPAYGIQSIFTDKSSYSHLNFTKMTNSKKQIIDQINNLNKIKKPSLEQINKSKQYLFIRENLLGQKTTLLPNYITSRIIIEDDFWKKCIKNISKYDLNKDPLFEMFNKQLKYNSRHTLNYKILNFKNTIFNDLND